MLSDDIIKLIWASKFTSKNWQEQVQGIGRIGYPATTILDLDGRFLLFAFLQNFFLRQDRLSGDVPPHLAQPCYVALGRALIWGLYPDYYFIVISIYI